MIEWLAGGFRLAARDLAAALEALLRPRLAPWRLLAPPVLGLAGAWFAYVPVHELLHVAGCLATGGAVTELRLATVYGAGWLRPLFPFIVPSRGAAARLSGFSTNGSDLCYLATDLAPYLLTVLVGVPLLRAVAAPSRAWWGWRRWLFGPAVVLAAAPFISLTGDYFEIGTILVTAPLGAWAEPLRSDELFRLIGELAGGAARPGGGAASAAITAASLGLGLVLAGWTYRLGAAWAATASRWRRRAA